MQKTRKILIIIAIIVALLFAIRLLMLYVYPFTALNAKYYYHAPNWLLKIDFLAQRDLKASTEEIIDKFETSRLKVKEEFLDMSDWSVYRDEKYGYSISYLEPTEDNDCTLKNEDKDQFPYFKFSFNCNSFGSPDGVYRGSIRIDIYDNSEVVFEDFKQNYIDNKSDEEPTESMENINFQGENALSRKWGNGDLSAGTDIIVQHKSYIFHIQGTNYYGNSFADQIISTFRFID